ncbi:lipase [Streptomyces sp. SCA3-4]|uniref:alpha/beta hydrolase family protein n=1 Tax=Streptomyces sichuanensis TaxID=2871810 RepID=UPI001CE39B29|nr:lipase [Streptomyces sichuanensis]MCA6092294.1 lipase [Streptomyces sichuanensis]
MDNHDQSRNPTRRRVAGALGLALLAPAVGATTARAATAPRVPWRGREPLTPALPAPTGPYRVGTTSMHLVDGARRDPWVPSRRRRELMVSLWYPARPGRGTGVAPQLPARTAARFGALAETEQGFSVGAGAVDWAATRTHSAVGAPVLRQRGGLPVVLYSPGKDMPRGFGTVLAEDLASRGYAVVAVDHTYESLAVEFPGGRLEEKQPATETRVLRALVDVRVADVRFVLDCLEVLNAGGTPDASRRPLPAGLARGLDLSAIGMFGHSLGGATTAQVMHDDHRVVAGANLDGGTGAGAESVGTVVDEGLDRPFLLVSSVLGNSRHPAHATFWQHLRGWHRNIQMLSASHYSFTDLQAQLPRIAQAGAMPRGRLVDAVGTVAPARSLHVQRTYLGAFLDAHLLHRPDHGLFDGPSPAFPEVQFVD